METTSHANAGDLLGWAFRNGFRRDERYSNAVRTDLVRVIILDDEGYFKVIRFEARNPQAEIEAWTAEFGLAPLEIITATITAAKAA